MLKGLFENQLLKILFSPGMIILLILVIIGVVLLIIYRDRAKKLFGTATGLLLAIIFPLLLFFFVRAASKPGKEPMSSTTMFKKMEYMEELRLVSFYSEEVLVLGTKENIQRLVENLDEELKALNQQVTIAEAALNSQKEELDALIEQLVTDKEKFKTIEAKLKLHKKEIKAFRKFNPDNTYTLSDSLMRKTGTVINTMFQEFQDSLAIYQDSLNSIKTKKWKSIRPKKLRREKRRDLKEFLKTQEIRTKQLHEAVLSQLKIEHEIQRDQLNALQEFEDEKARELKKNKRAYHKRIKDGERALQKLRNKQQRGEEKLKEAKMELAFAIEEGNDIEPEILIVAPAEIAVFINMKNVEIEEIGDSVLNVFVPPIEFAPALIELPDSAGVYDIDSRQTEWEISQQGAYFDLFDQLKGTLLEKQTEVQAKAIENGIIQEGEKMAKIYLENFMRPLGLEVNIIQTQLEE